MTSRELEHLRKVYLRAEIAIINEIARLRSQGLIDYHAVMALDRVQKILLSMQDETWKYAPRMIERYFYVNHPAAYTRAPKTVTEHLRGYEAAMRLTSTEQDACARLVFALIADLESSSTKIMADLSDVLLGRKYGDVFRREGLEASIKLAAGGTNFQGTKAEFIDALRRDGVTAFVDKAGRQWSLHAYTDMVLRTTVKQASTIAVITKDPAQDLFYIVPIGSTCKVCAPLEGRVYSRSGTDPVFPPLASAFGKIDKNGANTLENSYLNIHPNCLHAIVPWSREGKSREEIKRMEDFSNPAKNPFDRDPRTEAQKKAYDDNQTARRKMLAAFKEFENMRLAIPGKVPKTLQTFLKHKMADDDKYKAWVAAYKEFKRG